MNQEFSPNLSFADISNVKRVAKEWHEKGADIVVVNGKTAVHNWAEYQERKQTQEEFDSLPWTRGNGFAIVGGSLLRNNLYIGIIDVDVKNASQETLNRQKKFLDYIRVTYHETTPSGGRHLFYYSTNPVESVAATHQAAKWCNIEVIGTKRLCVMHPSPGYRPAGSDLITTVDSLTDLYFTTLKRIGYESTTKKEFVNIPELLRGVKTGERDNAAIRLAVYYRKQKHSKDQVLEKLIEWDGRNEQPLGVQQLNQKIESAFSTDTPYNFSFIEPGKEGKHSKLIHKLSGICEMGPYEAVVQGDKLGFLVYKENGEFEFMETIMNDSHPVAPKEPETIPKPGHYGIYDGPMPQTQEIFNMVRTEFDVFVDVDEKYKDLLAACVLLTYQIEKVNTTLYTFFYGDNETGKSVCLQLQQWLCYRPLYAVSPTASDIYGYLGENDTPGTILEDEAQGFWKDTDKVKIYKSGYKYGISIPRWWDASNGTKQLRYFPCFGYKCVASEQLPNVKGLIERFIFIPMSEGIPKRDWADVNEDDFKRLRTVRNLLLKWRLMTRLDNPLPNLTMSVHGRLKELWKPILQVTDGLPVAEKLREFLNELQTDRLKDKKSTLEGRIVKMILEKWDTDKEVKEYYNYILWDALREELKGEVSDPKKPHEMETPEFGKVSTVRLGYRIRELFGVKSEVFKVGQGQCQRGYTIPSKGLLKLARKYGYDKDEDLKDQVTRLQVLQVLQVPGPSQTSETMESTPQFHGEDVSLQPISTPKSCNSCNLVTNVQNKRIDLDQQSETKTCERCNRSIEPGENYFTTDTGFLCRICGPLKKEDIQPILEYIVKQTRSAEWAERESIFREFEKRGTARSVIARVLLKLEREGTIYSPREGFVRKA